MDAGKKNSHSTFFWMNRKKLIIKHSGHFAKLYDTPLYANDSAVTFWMYADTQKKKNTPPPPLRIYNFHAN